MRTVTGLCGSITRGSAMGDMAEVFNAMKTATKKKRSERLKSTSDEGWSKHTDYHWYRTIDGVRLNYWPSSGLVMIGPKKFDINNQHIKTLIRESQEQ